MQTKKTQDYGAEISAKVTPEEAFDKIGCVPEWWAKNFEGKSRNVNDEFTVRFKSGDRYKIRILEIDPDKRIVWDIVDAFQWWVKNSSEWTGTKIVWKIRREKDGGVSIDMTHVGLVPAMECFNLCKKGWDYLMHESLSRYLIEGKGFPA